MPGARGALSCEAWNTREYFWTATAEDVTACLDAGAGLEARDDTGRTPLHQAAYDQKPVAVGTLLAAGADKEARDDTGQTPLHQAVSHDHPAAARMLLAAGDRCRSAG